MRARTTCEFVTATPFILKQTNRIFTRDEHAKSKIENRNLVTEAKKIP